MSLAPTVGLLHFISFTALIATGDRHPLSLPFACSRTNFPLVLISPSGSNKKNLPKGRFFLLAPTVGFEPTTNRLTADCSTAELSRNSGGRYRNRTDIEGFAVLCMSHSANRPVRYTKYQTQSTNTFISIFL